MINSARPNRISASLYREVKHGFEQFADASRHPPFWHGLLAAAQAEEELPEGDIIADELMFLSDQSTLTRRLRLDKPYVGLHPAVKGYVLSFERLPLIDEFWAFAAALSESGRLALDVLLRRALNPFEALATWPLEVLFTAEEVAWLNQASRTQMPPGASRPSCSWEPGHGTNYPGFICAILKLTRLCNLRCIYCHDWRNGPNQTMPFIVQAHLFQKLLTTPEHHSVDVVWHGGEPTLLGRRGFLRVLALERWFCRPGQRIKNILQTNGTRLTPEWAQFLARYRFRTGVSLDGPPEVHDRNRPNVSGRSTFEEVRRGLHTLMEANMLNGVLLVVSRDVLALGAETIVRFLQDTGLTNVCMLPVRPANGPLWREEDYLDHRTYVSFLLDVHRARKALRNPWIHVRELDSALAALRGKGAGFCELLGNCVGSFFSVDVNGTVAHCDKYVGDPAYYLGNILNSDFNDIRASERTQRLAEDNRQAAASFQSCPYFAYCRGWCPHERYVAQHYDPHYSDSCCGLAELFAALEEEA